MLRKDQHKAMSNWSYQRLVHKKSLPRLHLFLSPSTIWSSHPLSYLSLHYLLPFQKSFLTPKICTMTLWMLIMWVCVLAYMVGGFIVSKGYLLEEDINSYKYLCLHAAVSEETCKIWSEWALCRRITAFSCRLLGLNANTRVGVRYQISEESATWEREEGIKCKMGCLRNVVYG